MTSKARTVRHQKPDKTSLVAVIVLALIISIGINFFGLSLTGNVIGGGTEDSGEKDKGNPQYGVITGFVKWVIRDSGNNIIESSTPTEQVTVYFVPAGRLVNWSASITCSNSIGGKLKSVDSDSSNSSCSSVDYQSPTLYQCAASLTNTSAVIIYRTNTSIETGNSGCFASKTPTDSYDIYV